MSADSSGNSPRKPSPEDVLPSVEPPTAGFILQLFLIPLLIVSLVILTWLLFSWLAHAGKNDPQTVLKDLKRMGSNSWQRAYEMTHMLGADDAQGEELRHDPKLAGEIAALLHDDISKNGETIDAGKAKMRMFLCRALGSFQITDVVPALLEALAHEGCPEDVQVRIAAAESLAVLADRIGPAELRERDDVVPALVVAASRDEKSEAADDAAASNKAAADPRLKSNYRPHAELRAVAAYALGVIGGQEATDKLLKITELDPYASARYNAATGLARQGDERVIPTLVEMLNPANEAPAENEWHKTEKEQQLLNVLKAGMQAALRLAETNREVDLTKVLAALEQLATGDAPQIEKPAAKRQVSLQAAETKRLIEKLRAE